MSEIGRRHWNGSVNVCTALLEASEDDPAAIEFHTAGGDLQSFGDTAAGESQRLGEGPHVRGMLPGGGKEGAALLGAQIEAVALGVV